MFALLSALLMQEAAASEALKASEVDWAAKPSALAMVAAFPTRLSRTHLAGRALIECDVVEDGRLGRCRTLSETPTEAGVGDAAMSVAPSFRMTAKTREGKPTAGQAVQIPIVFVEPGERLEPMIRRDATLPPGEAEVSCRVSPGGAVDDCFVMGEWPYAKGLGSEALRLTAKLGLRTRDVQRIILTYRFRH